jgi:hypothetical protein
VGALTSCSLGQATLWIYETSPREGPRLGATGAAAGELQVRIKILEAPSSDAISHPLRHAPDPLQVMGPGCSRTKTLGVVPVSHPQLLSMTLLQVKTLTAELALAIYGVAVQGNSYICTWRTLENVISPSWMAVLDLGADDGQLSGEGLPDELTVREAGFPSGARFFAMLFDSS